MPETCFPIRTGRQVSISSSGLTLILLSLALGGCSGGDFGRTREDFRNDDMHRWMGGEVTGSVGLGPSQFQLTDNERQLRDLAYPLIEPPRSRPAWKSVFGDYKPLASPWRQGAPAFDRSAYGRMLIDEPHRSNSSRYSQLTDDVRDDITRFEPFFATATRVLDLDRKRNASLAHVSELSPRERTIIAGRRLCDEGATLEELGRALGVSKERVRQLEHRALQKLRQSISRHVEQARDLLIEA